MVYNSVRLLQNKFRTRYKGTIKRNVYNSLKYVKK